MSENMSNYTQADMMTVAMARLLRDEERVFHGVASPIPMVAVQLAKRRQAPNLIYLSITGAVDGLPESFPRETTTDGKLLRNTASLFSLTEIFDLSARGQLDTAFLGGVQIDQYGNLNLSVIGDFHKPKVRLPGGAGSAALLPTTKRAILWRTKHDPKVFVEKLSFRTAVGNVDKVITPLGIFSKEAGKLKLWQVFPYSSVEEITAQTGFPVEKSPDFVVAEAPTAEELALLQEIDPDDVRSVEF